MPQQFSAQHYTRNATRNLTLNLKLIPDLSHWCVACERVFDPAHEPRDKWWPQYLVPFLF